MISGNHGITVKFINTHPNMNWNIYQLGHNDNVVFELINSNMECVLSSNLVYNMEYVCSKINITHEFIDSHLNWKWNMCSLSANQSITPEFINSRLDLEWDMYGLCRNTSITLEFIESHEWGWDAEMLSSNSCITPEFVESHPEWKWDMYLAQPQYEYDSKSY